ncbi:MAG TPA: zinc-ribbon domain-containing protein [Acidimicrobiales bacterium]|nr:zinc-ribbon domain-containing protein [Acidimicrobiales bacterium]
MTLTRRLFRARQLREARTRGFETALGLGDEPPATRTPGSQADLRCARCGATSRLETLDLRTSRGLVRCPSCDHSWSVVYPSASR